jgi:hypothetical protein
MEAEGFAEFTVSRRRRAAVRSFLPRHDNLVVTTYAFSRHQVKSVN